MSDNEITHLPERQTAEAPAGTPTSSPTTETLLDRALALATEAHAPQLRKGTTLPYITHPVAVARLVADFGGDAELQAAALLHDVLEDAGEHYAERIGALGPRVLAIVQACSDGVAGAKGPWRERKETYLAHLETASDDTLLVSACDKLHNVQSIAADLAEVGLAVFKRFNAPRGDVLWYYGALADVFARRGAAPAAAIRETLAGILAQVE